MVTDSTKPSDLLPYMNYVSVDTSGTVIDNTPTVVSTTCDATYPCVRLHNGGMLCFQDSWSFASSSNSNLGFIEFRFDPDPVNNTTSTADGPLKAVQFQLYRDGFLTTRGVLRPSTPGISGCACDPSWFSW